MFFGFCSSGVIDFSCVCVFPGVFVSLSRDVCFWCVCDPVYIMLRSCFFSWCVRLLAIVFFFLLWLFSRDLLSGVFRFSSLFEGKRGRSVFCFLVMLLWCCCCLEFWCVRFLVLCSPPWCFCVLVLSLFARVAVFS